MDSVRTRRLIRAEDSLLEGVAEITSRLAELGYHRGATPDREPVLLAYTPPARTNPLQGLLYGRALNHGVGVLPVRHWSVLPEVPWDGPVICHLHWVADVVRGAGSDAAAASRVDEFAAVLTQLKQRGHKVVWTAHNVLPHDSTRVALDVAVRRALVDAADAVHVMSTDTPRLLGEYVSLAEDTTFHVPHPSYVGAYPDHVSRMEARSELGIGANDFVIVLFGALQRYKGLADLQRAFVAVAQLGLPRKPFLVVAGKPPDEETATDLSLWAAGRDDVFVAPVRVPLEDVQYYYRAADLAVLPYQRGLNSGAALLALSFGVPVLASTTSGLGASIREFKCFSYDADNDQGLTEALGRLAVTDLTATRRHIESHIAARSPNAVSDMFFASLSKALRWPRRVVSG